MTHLSRASVSSCLYFIVTMCVSRTVSEIGPIQRQIMAWLQSGLAVVQGVIRRFPDSHIPGQTIPGQNVSRRDVSRTRGFLDRRFPDKTIPGQTIPGQDVSRTDISRTILFPDKRFPDKTFLGNILQSLEERVNRLIVSFKRSVASNENIMSGVSLRTNC